MNRLQEGAKRAAENIGRVVQKAAQFFDEVSNDELQKRIEKRDAMLRLTVTDDFKAFHNDAIQTIHADTRDLLTQSTKDFSSNAGVELRGVIIGKEDVFRRLATIIEDGNRAESLLEKRKSRRQFNGGSHTNLNAG